MKKGIIKDMTVLIPISKHRRLLKEAKGNNINYTEVRPNVYTLNADNVSKLTTFKRLHGLIEV